MSTKIEIKSGVVRKAVIDAFKKLHPRDEIKNCDVSGLDRSIGRPYLFMPASARASTSRFAWLVHLLLPTSRAMAKAGQAMPMPTQLRTRRCPQIVKQGSLRAQPS